MSRDSVWTRRVVLMAAIGLLVAMPATVLLSDDEDEGESPPAEVALGATTPELPALGPGGHDRGLDVSYRVPRGWSEEKAASAIRLRGPDRAAEIVIAAPASAGEADTVLDEALAAIREGYRDVEVARGSGRQLGGLDATGAVVTARAKGADLRILVAVANGAELTYLVEVFTSSAITPQRLREAQVALNSLRLEG